MFLYPVSTVYLMWWQSERQHCEEKWGTAWMGMRGEDWADREDFWGGKKMMTHRARALCHSGFQIWTNAFISCAKGPTEEYSANSLSAFRNQFIETQWSTIGVSVAMHIINKWSKWNVFDWYLNQSTNMIVAVAEGPWNVQKTCSPNLTSYN